MQPTLRISLSDQTLAHLDLSKKYEVSINVSQGGKSSLETGMI